VVKRQILEPLIFTFFIALISTACGPWVMFEVDVKPQTGNGSKFTLEPKQVLLLGQVESFDNSEFIPDSKSYRSAGYILGDDQYVNNDWVPPSRPERYRSFKSIVTKSNIELILKKTFVICSRHKYFGNQYDCTCQHLVQVSSGELAIISDMDLRATFSRMVNSDAKTIQLPPRSSSEGRVMRGCPLEIKFEGSNRPVI